MKMLSLYSLVIMLIGGTLPQKVINAINYNIMPLSGKSYHARSVPPSFYNPITNYSSTKIFNNDELIKTRIYDSKGKMVSSTSFKDGEIEGFDVNYYKDDKLIKTIDEHNQIVYKYYGDSLVTRKNSKLGEGDPYTLNGEYIITDSIVTYFGYLRNKKDTIKTYNYLTELGNQSVFVQTTNSDTLGVQTYSYDDEGRIIHTKYNHHSGDSMKKLISIFCNKERVLKYNNLGLISNKSIQVQCDLSNPNWELKEYQYETIIEKKKVGYEVKIIKYLNERIYRKEYLTFNKNNDITRKVIERMSKSTIDTFNYEYVYK